MSGFLAVPPLTAEGRKVFDEDIAEVGYVMNLSRLWAYQPDVLNGLFDLMTATGAVHGLGLRGRGVLVTACASALGDSYCSLVWGGRLATQSDALTAAAVLRDTLPPGDAPPVGDALPDGDASMGGGGLTAGERVMADWARKVARDPSGTSAADVRRLREAGFDDAQIFAMTVFVALRVAFSTVNAALGARPDAELRATTPAAVLDAVTYGRPISDA
ncbi:hypothetical protein [Nonomuraea cavernae]|uniref:Carboxymuconolactone decarboxylase n=1 Tax=Nonomuraea cavernae TaxID=2045107 RepID=A0A917YWU7_9ACTN|nr:hypothetical protein [Nonomuraea cavernae]MCA2187409.1 hypothetical protein [Nonomuraea cavernae]GGO68535.1 hypothetical protein GCM10012289_27530 [Nonomuraea cavernae]